MICAAILAGGIGSRLKEGKPKQFVNINNKPILVHSVEKFLNVKEFDKIIVSSPKECIDKTKKLGCYEEFKTQLFDFKMRHLYLRFTNIQSEYQQSFFNLIKTKDE